MKKKIRLGEDRGEKKAGRRGDGIWGWFCLGSEVRRLGVDASGWELLVFRMHMEIVGCLCRMTHCLHCGFHWYIVSFHFDVESFTGLFRNFYRSCLVL